MIPAPVLAAFDVASAVPLEGGQGTAWRAGSLVLKPVDDEAESLWLASVLTELDCPWVRLPRPVQAVDGRWVVDGWAACEFLEGEHDTSGRWSEVLAVASALNDALADLPRPSFLDRRTHAWSVGDRTAWGELPLDVQEPLFADTAAGLWSLVMVDAGPSQVIHGDLTANVLWTPGLPPAVIDLTPYWRPAGFCQAIVAVDAVCWYDAPGALLTRVSSSLLARAAVYRLVTSDLASGRLSGERRAAYVAQNAAAYRRLLALLT